MKLMSDTSLVLGWKRVRREDATSGLPEHQRSTYFGEVATSHRPFGDWLHEVDIAIKELLLLDEGWDGGVARAPREDAVTSARSIVGQVVAIVPSASAPTVIPSVEGDVVLEWHSEMSHVDLTVGGESVSIYYRDVATNREWEGPIEDAPENPLNLLYARFA